MANFSSPSRCGPRSSFWSGARWARSSTSTSPSSPRVQVTKQTAAPSDTYFGHSHAVLDRLVIGMGMNQHEPPGGLRCCIRSHGPTLCRMAPPPRG